MAEPLRSYLLVQRKYDQQTQAILQRTASDLARRIRLLDASEGVGARVRAAQLKLTLGEVNTALSSSLYRQLGAVVGAGAEEAAQVAQRAAQVLDDVLVRGVGGAGAEILSKSMAETARRGLAVDADRRARELSPRVYSNYRSTAGEIESTIRSGIIQGMSARELARTVYEFVSPTVPGGASYAAMRLSRTEINNGFHTQQIKAGQKPWVNWSIWNLSGSHHRPDQCNLYADQKRFKPEEVPGKPHPQCLCYITYDTDSPEEFLNKFADGDFDDFLDEKMGVTFADAPAKLRIDHTGHNHPATPAGRAACRKAGGSDGSLMTAPRTIVEKPPATPPIRKTITPGRKMTVDEFKARQARLGLGPKPVEVPSPITHQHDHSHPHPYDDEARTRVRQSVVHHSVKIRRDEVFEALDHEGEIMGGEVMGKLRVVDTVKKADINAQYYQGIGRLQIEQTFLKGGPRVHEGFLRSQRSGYKTKVADGVTPLQRTLTHEMGHHVESVIMGPYGMAVRESVFNEIADSLGLPRPVLHTRTGMDKWVKRYYAKIHKEVSAYGATNSAEMLAEIWTEYSRGGTKMRPHIKRIGRLIEKYLREYTAP